MTSTLEVGREGSEERGRERKGKLRVGGRNVNDLYFTIKDLKLDLDLRGKGRGERKGEERERGK